MTFFKLLPITREFWAACLLGRVWIKYQSRYIVINAFDVPATNYFLIYCFQSSTNTIPMPTWGKKVLVKECDTCRRIEVPSFRVLQDILYKAFPDSEFQYFDIEILKELLKGKY